MNNVYKIGTCQTSFGTPLQSSCLENPMDAGAWWAAVHGVAKSWREQLHFNFSLLCTGEGDGNPLQGSCLMNPRDGGAWWAAIYGVTQSRTWLKRLSSSSKLLYMLKELLQGLWGHRLWRIEIHSRSRKLERSGSVLQSSRGLDVGMFQKLNLLHLVHS